MTNDERKIKEKLQHKTWNEIKTKDAWGIFKVMAEFVDGYEKLSKIGPCVSVFGSA
ncbi:MAG: TIGR00730 family Rossman fold protein, partial [Polaribacter sp.]|nr:TIGR00730 family Rossman fold protein [Polaribacter sp.]